MKFRTADELSSYLRDDLAWRRKELRVLEGMVQGTVASKQQAVLRGAIAALYAHWEGFVKAGSNAYIDYVRLRGLSISELGHNFVGLIVRPRIKHLAASGKAQDYADFMEWIVKEWNSRAYLPASEKLSTQSNLGVDVFKDIVSSLGLNYRREYAVAEKSVIEPLRASRNNLAHGQWEVIDPNVFFEYLKSIDELLNIFCNELESAAIDTSYRRKLPQIT